MLCCATDPCSPSLSPLMGLTVDDGPSGVFRRFEAPGLVATEGTGEVRTDLRVVPA